jgi:hypothetical protein
MHRHLHATSGLHTDVDYLRGMVSWGMVDTFAMVVGTSMAWRE